MLLEGSGLVNVDAADDPQLFTRSRPRSRSVPRHNVNHGAQAPSLLSLSDAGGGAGTWRSSSTPQAATAGASLTPGAGSSPSRRAGRSTCRSSPRATPARPRGDDYGFVVLRRGADRARVPYYFR